ncbi:uncharacterized protein LOC133719962 [Rosa rugosa]|uniref:uncharacterized protein LOC133719962 n=1 Tax=Rosa rugosa TaxID=74645 RepID=UPI002B411E29|nr:uncharacterized protein LOC133719962 [Rosa rugosa]XP_062002144.1 uncharacterized protein LOC133719962 [Rosa rugosa]
MKPEIIDWSNIESIFVEDETYENFKAPKWVDLSAPDELIDDEAWFCNPDCKHPKSAEDFHKSARSLKGKLLRSLSVSEILPFRGKSQRDVKLKGVETKPPSAAKLRNMKTKSSNYVCSVNDENENKNPNMAAPLPIAPCKSKSRKASMTPCNEKKKQGDESSQDSSKHGVKPKLKSTFSASNLLKGREILNQITEFCTDMKNLTKRCSRKQTLENSCLKEKVRERMPLIVREGDY